MQSLRTDTADLNLNQLSTTSTLASIDTILAYFDQGRDYEESLATHFQAASIATNVEVEQLFVNGNWSDGVRPLMMENFSYQFLFRPAVPHDYSALAKDSEFRTLLMTTRGILRWKFDLSSEALQDAQALIAHAELELADR